MSDRRRIEMAATFFFLGRAPLMPGTIGTLGAIPVVLLLNFMGLGLVGYTIAMFIMSLLAIRIADQYEQMVQDHDSKEVVVDEVAGFVITMFWLPMTWQALVAGFVLFRILDIFKPFPINLIDRRGQGGFGTVADDIVAGVIANVILQFVYTQTDWLGVRYVFN